MRRLLVVSAFVIVSLLVPAPGGDAAPRCKKFREQKGCRLPNPAGFAAKGNVFGITVTRLTDANGRFSVPCTGGGQAPSPIEVEWPIDEKLNFPGRPKVGSTHRVESITENPPGTDGSVSKYEWRGRLTITSAKKASLTLSFTSVTGKPSDVRTCEGAETKTLARVTYLR